MKEDHQRQLQIVLGKEHLGRILLGVTAVQRESTMALKGFELHADLIGTSLTALFEASTCHRGCNGGPHILEAVCARAYNLRASAYLLAVSGFYDESANLIRSIGEIANLVSLSTSDPTLFRDWLVSDPETRKKKFSPYKVRMALENSGGIQVADEDWYTRFCEGYTHISPTSNPGMHNEARRGISGGVYQPKGLQLALDELANVLVPLALFVSRFFKFEDLISELTCNIEKTLRKD